MHSRTDESFTVGGTAHANQRDARGCAHWWVVCAIALCCSAYSRVCVCVCHEQRQGQSVALFLSDLFFLLFLLCFIHHLRYRSSFINTQPTFPLELHINATLLLFLAARMSLTGTSECTVHFNCTNALCSYLQLTALISVKCVNILMLIHSLCSCSQLNTQKQSTPAT